MNLHAQTRLASSTAGRSGMRGRWTAGHGAAPGRRRASEGAESQAAREAAGQRRRLRQT
jgi:hypothetical protein